MSNYALATLKTDTFLQTQREAKKNKEDCRNNADPILQRNTNQDFNPKPSRETRNYFTQLQNGDDNRVRKKPIPQKTNYLFTDNSLPSEPIVNKSHKRPMAGDYEARIHAEKPQMIKMIKCKASDSQINTIFDTESPIEKERPHVKFTVNKGQPSAEYMRMTEKQNNLPHSISNGGNRGAKSVDHLKGGQIVNLTQEEKIRKKNNIQQKSSIGELLNQDGNYCFGVISTGKPNETTFDVLKKSLDVNKKKYVKPAHLQQ